MHDYIVQFRDFFNQPRVQNRLMRELGKWSQLCASMDVIVDAEGALASYRAQEYGATRGGRYLALYGLLQATFLQQDAVRHLCEALGMPEKIVFTPRLKDIREIRNDSIGRPTKGERKKQQSQTSSFISQLRMQHNSF